MRLLADLAVPLLAIGACIVLYRLGFAALAESLFSPEGVLVTVFRRLGVIVSLFLGYWAAARYYERRRPTELALEPVPAALSALLGIGLIGATILALFALGQYRLLSVRGVSAALPLMSMIVLMVVIEEAVFRGVIFRLLEKHTGTVSALVVQSLGFGLLHLLNEGTTAVTVISVTLLGAFWSLIFVHSRNLSVVIANHAAWNLTIFVAGVPLSGAEEWRLSAPLETASEGPLWLTGGSFGPEDSVVNILVMAGAVLVLASRTRRKGAFVAGAWESAEGS
ncbi:MAG: type II CAAX endopeptidase family protein [Thermoanaerobaculia bacterium]|nr:type II CAAX endopeptidase family protein [Thermoanaerobaculia bacterium]